MRSLQYRPVLETPEPKKEEKPVSEATSTTEQTEVDGFDESVVIN